MCRGEPPFRNAGPGCSRPRSGRYPPAPLPPLPIGPPARLVLAAGLLFPGCCLAPRADARFLRFPSFETPEAAFESLRAALRADDPSAEYRCFARAFRRDHGLRGADSWRIARARVLRENPEIRWIARARLGPVTRTARERASALATVLGRSVRIDFAREDVFEATLADGRRIDDYLPAPLPDPFAVAEDRLRVDLRDPRFRDVPVTEIDRLLVGGEWKILDVGSPGAP